MIARGLLETDKIKVLVCFFYGVSLKNSQKMKSLFSSENIPHHVLPLLEMAGMESGFVSLFANTKPDCILKQPTCLPHIGSEKSKYMYLLGVYRLFSVQSSQSPSRDGKELQDSFQ